MKSAILRRASDIHLNVRRERDVQVRLRVDGRLEDFMRIPKEQRVAVINRLKVLSRMDIAEKRAPQDGAFRFEPPPLFRPWNCAWPVFPPAMVSV